MWPIWIGTDLIEYLSGVTFVDPGLDLIAAYIKCKVKGWKALCKMVDEENEKTNWSARNSSAEKEVMKAEYVTLTIWTVITAILDNLNC